MSSIALQHDLDRLGNTLRRYRELSGKSDEVALPRHGRNLTFFLAKRYGEVRNPSNYLGHRSRILKTAKSLNYALGNISPRAGELANTIMSGQKSVVGRVVEEGSAVMLRTVRIGKRGRRITGGRRGRGGRAASLAEYRADGFERLDGEVVLNRRAVSVVLGVILRMRGTGSLAASWLFRQWRKTIKGAFKLQNVNPKSQVKVMGEVESVTGGTPTITITSKMPGVTKFPAATALALRDLIADVDIYNRRKQAQDLKGAGFR